MPECGEDLLISRQDKLKQLRHRGIDPYPPRYNRTSTAHAAAALFEDVEKQQGEGARTSPVSVAGASCRCAPWERRPFWTCETGRASSRPTCEVTCSKSSSSSSGSWILAISLASKESSFGPAEARSQSRPSSLRYLPSP